MSILRTMKCNVEGCEEQMIEPSYGDGFRDWGLFQGGVDKETGETEFHVCPKHKIVVLEFLKELK